MVFVRKLTKNIYELCLVQSSKIFRNFPDLHGSALDAYNALKSSIKRYIELKNDREYDEKCVKVWAFLHGIVGLNDKLNNFNDKCIRN